MDHQQHDADDEQNPRDLRRNDGNARGAQNSGHQTNDEKHQRVIQHWDTSYSRRVKAEGVPSRFLEENPRILASTCSGSVQRKDHLMAWISKHMTAGGLM